MSDFLSDIKNKIKYKKIQQILLLEQMAVRSTHYTCKSALPLDTWNSTCLDFRGTEIGDSNAVRQYSFIVRVVLPFNVGYLHPHNRSLVSANLLGVVHSFNVFVRSLLYFNELVVRGGGHPSGFMFPSIPSQGRKVGEGVP